MCGKKAHQFLLTSDDGDQRQIKHGSGTFRSGSETAGIDKSMSGMQRRKRWEMMSRGWERGGRDGNGRGRGGGGLEGGGRRRRRGVGDRK